MCPPPIKKSFLRLCKCVKVTSVMCDDEFKISGCNCISARTLRRDHGNMVKIFDFKLRVNFCRKAIVMV